MSDLIDHPAPIRPPEKSLTLVKVGAYLRASFQATRASFGSANSQRPFQLTYSLSLEQGACLRPATIWKQGQVCPRHEPESRALQSFIPYIPRSPRSTFHM